MRDKIGAWFIGDTHFNHTNIIQYCDRPFANVEKMNNHIIQQWNNTVSKNDTVYHLGDFALQGRKETIKNLVNQLNGNIILILGNHDRHGRKWFLECGFIEVYRRLRIGNYLLTHKPQTIDRLPNDIVNIHGHTHGKRKLDRNKYIDVSCEAIGYKPVWL